MKKSLIICFLISLAAAVIGALALLFIPAAAAQDEMISYVLAALFWACLVIELVFVLTGAAVRRKIKSKAKAKSLDEPEASQKLPGIIAFFKNLPGLVCDIIFFIAVIAMAAAVLTGTTGMWLISVCIFVLVLSFNLHCLFNGKNFGAVYKFRKKGD